MESLVCKNCGGAEHTEKMTKDSLGREHLRADCSYCGKFMKFVQHVPYKMYYGKYKGKELKDVPKEYLEWCIENKTNGYLKIKDYLNGISN